MLIVVIGNYLDKYMYISILMMFVILTLEGVLLVFITMIITLRHYKHIL